MQKLPQLKILLERLLKKTPKDHPDRFGEKYRAVNCHQFWPIRSALRQSVQTLERLLLGINDAGRGREKAARVKGELFSRLVKAVRKR